MLPYHHRVWLAKETSTLDVMSTGRLIVGVGVGALRGRAQDNEHLVFSATGVTER